MTEEQVAGNEQDLRDPTPAGLSNVAIGITVAILGIMGVALAVDAASVPGLAVLAIVLVGSLIAALITWG